MTDHLKFGKLITYQKLLLHGVMVIFHSLKLQKERGETGKETARRGGRGLCIHLPVVHWRLGLLLFDACHGTREISTSSWAQSNADFTFYY